MKKTETNKLCQVCGKPYEYRLQIGGSGADKWCRHDGKTRGWATPDGLRSLDRAQIEKARPQGLGRDEYAVKHDGVIHIVERGG